MKENIVILRQENEQIDYINMNFNILQMGEINNFYSRTERGSKILLEKGGGLIIVLNCICVCLKTNVKDVDKHDLSGLFFSSSLCGEVR